MTHRLDLRGRSRADYPSEKINAYGEGFFLGSPDAERTSHLPPGK
jgi:hypothetical protein